MDEFSLINDYFKSIFHRREDVILGIGDDAACLNVPEGHSLLVSCDTLVADVHFLSSWTPYDIAWKALMVNLSDIAAMGGVPCWLTLSLTLPTFEEHWIQHFSQGLKDGLNQYKVALIGGDTTRGPLSMTLTIHGFVPEGCEVRRSGALPGDKIYVSGELGGAALAVASAEQANMTAVDKNQLMEKLCRPVPRVDLAKDLQCFASAAIDLSDGLSADLNHICVQSHVGARLEIDKIPIHPVVKKYQPMNALDFALSGGDDYELCFTVSPTKEGQLLSSLASKGLHGYCIGQIEEQPGLRGQAEGGDVFSMIPRGYRHF